jgi:hypothetical protein
MAMAYKEIVPEAPPKTVQWKVFARSAWMSFERRRTRLDGGQKKRE